MFSIPGLSSTVIQTEFCSYGWSRADFYLYPSGVSVQLHSPPPDGSCSLVTLGIKTFCLCPDSEKFYCSFSGQETFFPCMTNKGPRRKTTFVSVSSTPDNHLCISMTLRSPALSNLYCKYLVEATKENLANERKLLFFLGSPGVSNLAFHNSHWLAYNSVLNFSWFLLIFLHGSYIILPLSATDGSGFVLSLLGGSCSL